MASSSWLSSYKVSSWKLLRCCFQWPFPMSHFLQRCSHWKVAHIPINILTHTCTINHNYTQWGKKQKQNENIRKIYQEESGFNRMKQAREADEEGGKWPKYIISMHKNCRRVKKKIRRIFSQRKMRNTKQNNQTTTTKPNHVNCQHWSVSALELCLWIPVSLHNCASCLSYMLCLFLCALHHITSFKKELAV